jgi:hypothetical protein
MRFSQFFYKKKHLVPVPPATIPTPMTGSRSASTPWYKLEIKKNAFCVLNLAGSRGLAENSEKSKFRDLT